MLFIATILLVPSSASHKQSHFSDMLLQVYLFASEDSESGPGLPQYMLQYTIF